MENTVVVRCPWEALLNYISSAPNNTYILYEEHSFIVTAPSNSWDMNYHAFDTVNRIEYLIDIDDIESKAELEDIYHLQEISWQQKRY